MKYIITESKLEQVVIKYLNKAYGDLEEYRTDEYPNSIFYVKDKKVYMEQDLETFEVGMLWVDYNTIWSDLKNIFGLESPEIKHIITKWAEETYKLKDVTPNIVSLRYERWWKKLMN